MSPILQTSFLVGTFFAISYSKLALLEIVLSMDPLYLSTSKSPLPCPYNEAAECTAALLARYVPAAQLALLFIFGISWRTTTGRLALAIEGKRRSRRREET